MVSQNYCYKCGKRVLPNEELCSNCGSKTLFKKDDNDYVFAPPVHNIGFFNFSVDFSPYIIRKNRNYKYSICSCGYVNPSDYVFCSMCGKKHSKLRKNKFIKNNVEDAVEDTVVCDCGTVNLVTNNYCEMCGRKLYQDEEDSKDDYHANFNLEYYNSVFCYCGEENDISNKFCSSCGTPLINYNPSKEYKILCVCGEINSISSKYCMGCGIDLSKEVKVLSCVCGAQNSLESKLCSVCGRPLNSKRVITSKIICKCGAILSYSDDFCPSCGKNIKRSSFYRRLFR